MKILLLTLALLFVLPGEAQEYVKKFSAQKQFDTQYSHVEAKYAYENYKGNHKKWQKNFHKELSDLLGITDLQERYKDFVPKAEQIDSEDLGFATRERWQIWTEPTMIIPMVIIRPKGDVKNLTLCITPQGHNRNPEVYSGIAANEKEAKEFQTRDTDVAYRAGKMGFITINPTTRGFGKTMHPDDVNRPKPRRSSCEYYSMRDVLSGRVLIGDRVWDVMKIIDWALANLPIDPNKVVVTGNSGGGTVSIYAGAIDKRISLCAPSSAFCSYYGSIGSIHHCTCNYVPGILKLCDMGDLAGLVAPRKLLIINGVKDNIFPIGPAREEFKTAQAVYKAFGVEKNCELFVGHAGHRYYFAGFEDYYNRHFK